MNLIFFTHPRFLTHQSMPRFTNMLSEGMIKRGHKVEIWAPEPYYFKTPLPLAFKKWLSYIDQYIVFPIKVKKRLQNYSAETLFVFTDQALGPWIPLVKNRPHVVHCHDFLAQRSAIAQIPENPTSWTGRQYQTYIKNGYRQAKNFVSVSHKTERDLIAFLTMKPLVSEVVYNGMNRIFSPQIPEDARSALEQQTGVPVSNGYILHVGGNQWYKNRVGVVELYNAWRNVSQQQLPLLLIGEDADDALLSAYNQSPFTKDIYFLSGVDDTIVKVAYAGASLLIFPSHAEGFGWPIAEAMASGCPVVTTNEAPMTEVAGNAAFLIPRRTNENAICWAADGAKVIEQCLQLTETERKELIAKGLENVKRFDTEHALNSIEQIYKCVLDNAKQ